MSRTPISESIPGRSSVPALSSSRELFQNLYLDWLHDDPHRAAYLEQALLKPTLPIYEAYNPAFATIGKEETLMNAAFDITKNGMSPEAAIDKAFKRAEEIFAKYPIAQS